MNKIKTLLIVVLIVLSTIILVTMLSSCNQRGNCLECEQNYMDSVTHYNQLYQEHKLTDEQLSIKVKWTGRNQETCLKSRHCY